MKKVLVVSAHPDDEVLGCGGTLARHIEKGDELYWLITTSLTKEAGFSESVISKRDEEILQIKDNLKIKDVFQLGYGTTSLTDETLIKMIPKIGKIFKTLQPEVIYVTNRSDAHSDHLITFKAIMSCTKSFRYPSVKKILMYECISETEFGVPLAENAFIPNYFVDISDFMQLKLDLMKIYKSELGEHPFPRSLRNIEALATFRGASSGVEYAEAFQLLKCIDK